MEGYEGPAWAKDYIPEYSTETLEQLAKEFPQVEDTVYLDHAAATLYSRSQVEGVARDLATSLPTNPHSGGHGAELMEEARAKVIAFLGASDYSLVFTSGATAALRLAGECWRWGPGGLVLHQESHTSAVGLREIATAAGAEVKVKSDEEVLKWLDEEVDMASTLFCFPAMSNFNGRKLPLGWVGRVQSGGGAVLLDTAALLATGPLVSGLL